MFHSLPCPGYWGSQYCTSYHILIFLSVIPSLLALPLLPTMLESPLWLLMKNRKEEARSVLKRIRGQVYDVEPEIFQIEEALRIKKGTFKDVVKTGTKPFVLLFFLMFFQTGSGCDTISIYALIIFSEFKLSGTVFSIIL